MCCVSLTSSISYVAYDVVIIICIGPLLFYVLYIYVLSVGLHRSVGVVVSPSLNNIFGHVTRRVLTELVRTPAWWQRWDMAANVSLKLNLRESSTSSVQTHGRNGSAVFNNTSQAQGYRQRGGRPENKYAALLSGGRKRRPAH